ncbi:MAG TPA: hypothetical protein EYH01_05415 [Campylobacterales bacterium]|nr:hypothetical protein [Campylobacterales bacterium]
MSRENTSSVDMANGKKMAYYGSQEKAALKSEFHKSNKEVVDQVVNARKPKNLTQAKAKAKKRAKMAKASRKKNKK